MRATDVSRLKASATAMAKALRSYEGVRHVEAVGFGGWFADPDPKNPLKDVPWVPYGALVFVEGATPEDLDRYVNIILKDTATKFDPDRMKLNPMDSF